MHWRHHVRPRSLSALHSLLGQTDQRTIRAGARQATTHPQYRMTKRKSTGPREWPNQDHPYKRLRLNGKIVIVDELLADIVRKLNRAGAKTDFCCQGNHHAADDRRYFHDRSYISVNRKGKGFPKSLVELAERRGFQTGKYYLCATSPMASLPQRRVRTNNRRFLRMLREWARV